MFEERDGPAFIQSLFFQLNKELLSNQPRARPETLPLARRSTRPG